MTWFMALDAESKVGRLTFPQIMECVRLEGRSASKLPEECHDLSNFLQRYSALCNPYSVSDRKSKKDKKDRRDKHKENSAGGRTTVPADATPVSTDGRSVAEGPVSVTSSPVSQSASSSPRSMSQAGSDASTSLAFSGSITTTALSPKLENIHAALLTNTMGRESVSSTNAPDTSDAAAAAHQQRNLKDADVGVQEQSQEQVAEEESDEEKSSDEDDDHNEYALIRVGVCARDKKTKAKPMQEILRRFPEDQFECIIFGDDCVDNKPVEDWPIVDCLIAFYSSDFPLEKAQQYVALRNPWTCNDLQVRISSLSALQICCVFCGC